MMLCHGDLVPERTAGMFELLQLAEQSGGVFVHRENAAVFGGDEAVRDRVVDELNEGVVIVIDIEDADGLGLITELAPGEGLEQFFERAQAAGQGDERVGELGHGGFAGVHRVDDHEFADAFVHHARHIHRVRDDANGPSSSRQHGIG